MAHSPAAPPDGALVFAAMIASRNVQTPSLAGPTSAAVLTVSCWRERRRPRRARPPPPARLETEDCAVLYVRSAARADPERL